MKCLEAMTVCTGYNTIIEAVSGKDYQIKHSPLHLLPRWRHLRLQRSLARTSNAITPLAHCNRLNRIKGWFCDWMAGDSASVSHLWWLPCASWEVLQTTIFSGWYIDLRKNTETVGHAQTSFVKCLANITPNIWLVLCFPKLLLFSYQLVRISGV